MKKYFFIILFLISAKNLYASYTEDKSVIYYYNQTLFLSYGPVTMNNGKMSYKINSGVYVPCCGAAFNRLIDLELYDIYHDENIPVSSIVDNIKYVSIDSNFWTYKESFDYMFEGLTSLITVYGLADFINYYDEHFTEAGHKFKKSMVGIFKGCSSLRDPGFSYLKTNSYTRLITDDITSMRSAFEGCTSLKDIDLRDWFTFNWDVDLSRMFYGCSSLRRIYCNYDWSTLRISNSTNMFYGCTSLIGGAIPSGIKYDSSKTDHTYACHTDGYFTAGKPFACYCEDRSTLVFYQSPEVKKDPRVGQKITVSLYNEPEFNGEVTDMIRGACIEDNDTEYHNWLSKYRKKIQVVYFRSSFIPVSLYGWFSGFSELQTIHGLNFLYSNRVRDMRFMFEDCSNLESVDMSTFATYNVTNMGGMFWGCSNLKSVDLSSNFQTLNVTDMGCMFYGCSNLTSLDLSNFNTSKATNMNGMFYGCSKLTSLDLSKFNTSNVTNMGSMFYGCSKLTSLDLSKFNTSNVTNMGSMFYGCSNLKTIYCNDEWQCANSTDMFYDCKNLVGGKGKKYGNANTNATYANPGKIGYFTLTLLMGDVNADEEINLLDVVKMVDYIMTGDSNLFNKYAGDHYCDDEINLFDLVQQVKLVLAQNNSAASRRIQGENVNISSCTLDLSSTDYDTFSFGLPENEGVIATQFILELSDGMSLGDILTDSNHTVDYVSLSDNRYAVVCYSASNKPFDDCNEMVRIKVNGNGIVDVSDVIAVSLERELLHLKSIEKDITTGLMVVPEDATFDIYSPTGVVVKRNVSSTEGLPKGTYIVNGKKVLIK